MTTHEEKFRNIFIVEHDNESEINEEELQSTSIRRVENIEEKEEPRERIEVLTTEIIVAILDKTLRDICQESVNLIDEIMCKVWIEVMLLLNEIVSNVWNVTVQLVQKIAKEVITTFFTIINSLLRLIETDVKRYCSDVAADLGKAYKNMINSAKRSQLVHKVAKKVITTFFNIITSLIRLIEPHVKRYCSNLTAGLKGVYQDMINSARSQPRKS
ncbi:hypothetical protein E2C01_057312 [Portunus trituberculatus]|uniref:Uncharacterized protein n=1 Tax=Portunus trituberculatus TaxID=210409 RepID=A0A5B7H215_PORTR|nr:hypothetical protein [Portunus trituberculatus]